MHQTWTEEMMTTVLPLNTVIQIKDSLGNICGYGLEVTPGPREFPQYWFFNATKKPATRPGQDTMMPRNTIWEPAPATDDWAAAKTPELFCARAKTKFARGRTIFATAEYGGKVILQPDVGGFELIQDGAIVGLGYVAHIGDIYRELWFLTRDFRPARQFKFNTWARKAAPSQTQELDSPASTFSTNPPGYLSTVQFDVTYYDDAVP
jgi:hypothetical protein